MTDTPSSLAVAEANATLARERLSSTFGLLQAKLNPKVIARDAAQGLAEAGTSAAKSGVETAKRNPGAVAGITALAGLFLARHKLGALFGRKRDETRR